MLKLNELRADPRSRKQRHRVARGAASGSGKTAGRGNKGAQSRRGKSIPYQGFEGGQTPLYRRLPKLRGYKNKGDKAEMLVLNVGDLDRCKSAEINIKTLQEADLISKRAKRIKILGDGDINRAVTLKVNGISKTAEEKIKKAGGKVEIIA